MKFTTSELETATVLLVSEESTESAKSAQLEPHPEPKETAALVESINNWLMVNAFAPQDSSPTNSEFAPDAAKYQELSSLTELALFAQEI